jgi:FixJ family two-component response regulator
LLLLDFHLGGGVTGIALRATLGDAAMRLPCVVITADHDPAIRAEIEAAGCHLLYKPLRPLALRSVMARIVASSAAHEG